MNEESLSVDCNYTITFKQRDIVTIKDVAFRLGVSEYTAGQLIRDWKVLLHEEGRDKLDIGGRLTKEDYAYVLGVDVKLFY